MCRILITGCGGHFMADTIACYRNQPSHNYIIGVASEPDPFLADLVEEYYKVPVSTDNC